MVQIHSPRPFFQLRSLTVFGISPSGSDARKTAQVQIHSPRPLLSVEVPHCVRDFAFGLRRPQNGSSSNPFAPTTSSI